MFFKEDKTFSDIRERSVNQWLDEMEGHEDLVVRDGVRATKEYIESLKIQIARLEEKCELREAYLRKLKTERITK